MAVEKKHKILIVEDNQENIDLLYYFLSPQGYDLTAVNDGLAAIKSVESSKPDIILLDIMMPKLDGFQVCERLKKNNETKSIPIIMITALKELKNKIRSLEAGADDFITKPFENVELLARVKSLLRLKEYHDEIVQKNLELKKKNESLIKMDTFKEDLVNLIVHDMKNPLFVIQGNLQMMAMGMDEKAQEYLKKYTQRIERSSHQLLRMVVNLLDISRIQDGTLELKQELTNLRQLTDEIIAGIKDMPENVDKKILTDISKDIPFFSCDKSIMGRIIENLLIFAMDNVDKDGKVLVKLENEEAGSLILSVHDNGTQIPKKFHDKIFEKFSQTEIKQNGYKVGRGLGLTFCKMGIEAHNGRMSIDLNNPVGNRFLIELPIE